MEKLADALYSQLLLRDFFGKIILGGVLLFSVAISYKDVEFRDIRGEISTITWMAILGLAWLTAFALQSAGELCSAFRVYPRGYNYTQWRDL